MGGIVFDGCVQIGKFGLFGSFYWESTFTVTWCCLFGGVYCHDLLHDVSVFFIFFNCLSFDICTLISVHLSLVISFV